MDRVKEATTEEEFLACFPTHVILQPHLKIEEYISRIRLQQTQGYRLMYIQDPENSKSQSLLAFRTLNYFYTGKTLCIEDVITAPEARGKGYAGILLNWIKKYATDNDYNELLLDSGYTRTDAHRMYLKNGFKLSAHQFTMHLKDQ